MNALGAILLGGLALVLITYIYYDSEAARIMREIEQDCQWAPEPDERG